MVTITIGDFTVKAEVASTKEQLTTGLSKRNHLANDEGLLLVLPKEGRIPITMKDMRFPIDVLFFDSKFRLIDIFSMFPTEIYTPSYSWQFALETKLFSFGKIPTEKYPRISDPSPSPSSSFS